MTGLIVEVGSGVGAMFLWKEATTLQADQASTDSSQHHDLLWGY